MDLAGSQDEYRIVMSLIFDFMEALALLYLQKDWGAFSVYGA